MLVRKDRLETVIASTQSGLATLVLESGEQLFGEARLTINALDEIPGAPDIWGKEIVVVSNDSWFLQSLIPADSWEGEDLPDAQWVKIDPETLEIIQ